MIIKIFIEIVIFILLLIVSRSFWFNRKSINYFKWVLSDYNVVNNFFIAQKEDLGKLKELKQFDDYGDATFFYLFPAGLTNYLKMEFLYLGLSALLIFGSHFLGSVFFIINVLLFFSSSLFVPTFLMRLVVAGTLSHIFSNALKWYLVNPKDCEEYCTKEIPKHLLNIYLVIKANS